MWVDRNNLSNLFAKMNLFSYETGGLLLGRDASISAFIFDEGVRGEDADEYIPNTEYMNEILHRYQSEEYELYGMIHSHRTREELSCADTHYARSLLRLNELDDILMPVYVLDSQNVFWYQVTMSDIKKLIISEGNLMEKQEKNMKEVIIPEGKCCAYTCGDCGYSDLDEKDRNGKIWCSA